MKLRKNLNNKVREFGNNRTKRIKEFSGKGLGDLLTTDVNFRRIGATTGALLPLVFWYKMGSFIGIDAGSNTVINTITKGIFASTIYGVTYYMSIPASIILGGYGYIAGEKIDRLIGNKSLKTNKQELNMVSINYGEIQK